MKKDKKPQGKYANMSPAKRFVHKNTGWIILGVALLCLAVWWNYNQIEQDFYYSWTCAMLFNYQMGGATFKGVKYDALSIDEQQKYDEFVSRECAMSFGNSTK